MASGLGFRVMVVSFHSVCWSVASMQNTIQHRVPTGYYGRRSRKQFLWAEV